jgi:hypothetical protein
MKAFEVKKVLVTGAGGGVGSHPAERLAELTQCEGSGMGALPCIQLAPVARGNILHLFDPQ